MASICLNMIVRNEAHVILRCLDSVRNLIQHWVIVDTGSTDGTQDVIRKALAGIPGTLHERPWRDFGHNRTEAIDLARGTADYLLFIDADDVLEGRAFVVAGAEPGGGPAELTADCYDLPIVHANLEHYRPTLVRAALPWRFVGVVHEGLECDVAYSRGLLSSPKVVIVGGGARSQVEEQVKFLRDAALLEGALQRDPGDTRSLFYLAQSYQDAGEWDRAIECYDRRTQLGGFAEERFVSRLRAARLAEFLRRPDHEVLGRYLGAHQERPTRAEALGEAARYCRENGDRLALAYLFARHAAALPVPGDILFIEGAWYAWRALDEWAVAAYWQGRPDECLEACRRLLDGAALPAEHRSRVEANRDAAAHQLGSAGMSRPASAT